MNKTIRIKLLIPSTTPKGHPVELTQFMREFNGYSVSDAKKLFKNYDETIRAMRENPGCRIVVEEVSMTPYWAA